MLKNALIFFFLSSQIFFSQIISIDEDFSDWDSVETAYADPANDFSGGSVDFGEFKIYNDARYIYFQLEVGEEINLQQDNSITIYLDADNNSGTGVSVEGIGADLEFTFGDRNGKFYYNGNSESIKAYDFGFLSAPTVTSTLFEFIMDLETNIGGHSVFPANTISLVIKNGIGGGDILPNESGGVVYTRTQDDYIFRPYQISKSDPALLRVMSYNVQHDHLFDQDKYDYFRRMLQAINPDIIGFEEIYNHSSQETADIITEFLPEYNWYHLQSNNDIIYVGKYPAINAFPIDGNTAFYLDLTDEFGKKMLFVAAHPPCCDNDEQRQREIDHFMAFIRDAKDGTGQLALEEDSPIVIVGDMNLVGLAQQQKTLITGEIVNQNDYGPSFIPDWDGTDFDDAKPLVTGHPSAFTWYNSGSSYSAGRLDYIVYTGSALEFKNSFSLFTPAMSADSLSAHGLNQNDAVSASDHIPIAADFVVVNSTNVTGVKNGCPSFRLEQNYPNPFNPATTIKYSIPETEGEVTLIIYDLLGREVALLVKERQAPGSYSVAFDASGFSSGVYFYRLTTGQFSETKSMLFLQ